MAVPGINKANTHYVLKYQNTHGLDYNYVIQHKLNEFIARRSANLAQSMYTEEIYSSNMNL